MEVKKHKNDVDEYVLMM